MLPISACWPALRAAAGRGRGTWGSSPRRRGNAQDSGFPQQHTQYIFEACGTGTGQNCNSKLLRGRALFINTQTQRQLTQADAPIAICLTCHDTTHGCEMKQGPIAMCFPPQSRSRVGSMESARMCASFYRTPCIIPGNHWFPSPTLERTRDLNLPRTPLHHEFALGHLATPRHVHRLAVE
jgi:hypothetical protein